MVRKVTKWPQNISISSIARPLKFTQIGIAIWQPCSVLGQRKEFAWTVWRNCLVIKAMPVFTETNTFWARQIRTLHCSWEKCYVSLSSSHVSPWQCFQHERVGFTLQPVGTRFWCY
jgi:hypothetical protein